MDKPKPKPIPTANHVPTPPARSSRPALPSQSLQQTDKRERGEPKNKGVSPEKKTVSAPQQRYVTGRTTLGGAEVKSSRSNNFWSPLKSKSGVNTMPKNGNHTGQQSSKKKAGGGRRRQRLAPNDLRGVGETSPPVSPPKEGDNSIKPELNHAQSTTRGTNAYGNPVPVPSGS